MGRVHCETVQKGCYKLIVVYINVGEMHECAHFLLQKNTRLHYVGYISDKVVFSIWLRILVG